MKTPAKFLAVTLIALTCACGLRAQAAASAAPKPPDRPSKVLLDAWNDIGRKLTAMAEDFPEDKYDFKPNSTKRSFAEQLTPRGELLPHQSGDRAETSRGRPETRGLQDQRGRGGVCTQIVCRWRCPDQEQRRRRAQRHFRRPFLWPASSWAIMRGDSLSTPASTTGSLWFITAWPDWCRQSRVLRSKTQGILDCVTGRSTGLPPIVRRLPV